MDKKERFLQEVKVLTKSSSLFTIAFFGIGFFLMFLVLFPDTKLFDKSPNITTEEVVADSLEENSEIEIKDGIHTETGFIAANGLEAVINNCTNCHSAKLVTQNRMTREGWLTTIRWMQKTQNLWDLGDQESIILDYLAKNYAPENKGRRQNLTVEEWYELK